MSQSAVGRKRRKFYQPVYEAAGLEGAVYEIRAAEDIYTPDGTLRYSKDEVVDTVTTTFDGTVKSKELYLGRYTVTEVEAPFGMVLSGETHEVELTYAGQEISVTETSTSSITKDRKQKSALKRHLKRMIFSELARAMKLKISASVFMPQRILLP